MNSPMEEKKNQCGNLLVLVIFQSELVCVRGIFDEVCLDLDCTFRGYVQIITTHKVSCRSEDN